MTLSKGSLWEISRITLVILMAAFQTWSVMMLRKNTYGAHFRPLTLNLWSD